MNDTLRCAVENVAVGARRSLVGRWRDGMAFSRAQVEDHRRAWAAHNAAVRAAEGPLWVVLGDSAAQGVGASSPFAGWPGQVRDRLQAADAEPGALLNLSSSGARIADVLAAQLTALRRLEREIPLVVCAIGGNDIYRSSSRTMARLLLQLTRSLPGPGELAQDGRVVLATLPQGLGRRRASVGNRVITEQAPRRGIEVADLWATTGPPWQDKFADDFFHPNEVGYVDWADAILATVHPGA